MGCYLIETSSNDGVVDISDAAWANVIGGTGAKTVNSVAAATYLGVNNSYRLWQYFCEFDTSVIPDLETVSSVRLCLKYQAGSNPAVGDQLVARVYDWGGNVDAGDWRSPAQLLAAPLVGRFNLADWSNEYWNFTVSDGAKSLINKTGMTRIVITSELYENSTQPVASHAVQTFTGNSGTALTKPCLVVVTESATPSFLNIAPAWGNPSAILRGVGAGDLLLAFYGLPNKTAITNPLTPPTGYTDLANAYEGANLFAGGCSYRFATVEDLTANRAGPTSYRPIVLVNVDPKSQIAACAKFNASGLNPISDPLVQLKPNTLFLLTAITAYSASDTTHSGYAIDNDNPALWIECLDDNYATQPNIGSAYAERPQATVTGNGHVTLSQARRSVVILLSLNGVVPSGFMPRFW